MPFFVLLERSWWAGFNGISFGKIWIQNVRYIEFKMISATENSNKFQKTRFWKEKSVQGRGNTWANGTCHNNIHESWIVAKQYGIKLRCYWKCLKEHIRIKAKCYLEHPWGTHWEPRKYIGNLMGTHWKLLEGNMFSQCHYK